MPSTFAPSKSARKTWFLRSAGFPFVLTHLRTHWFHSCLFHYFPIFLLGLDGFLLRSRSLVSWFSGRVRAVSGIPGYPRNSFARWNIRRGYLMHRCPRVPYTTLYDSHPFSLGHPYSPLTRSISCPDALIVVASWKNRLLVTSTADRARVVVFSR